MTYDEWIRGTDAGVLAVRSAELKALDKAFLAYTKAQTPYGRDWEGRETRIALEKWKAANPNWSTGERNRRGLIDRLDEDLPLLRRQGNGYGPLEGETAASLREGVLFFLRHSATSHMPTNLMGFLNDGTDTSSDMHSFIDTSGATGWRFWQGSFYDKDNKKNGFLESLSEQLIEYINELASFLRVDEFAAGAAKFIVNGLPDLLLQVFAGMLSKLTAVVDIAKGLRDAAKAAVAVWKSRHYDEAIMSGHPRIVIGAVRDQIKSSGYEGLGSAVKAGALAGLSAIPGVGTVVGALASAIASVWSFVTKVFDHFRDLKKLNKIFDQARSRAVARLHSRPVQFNRWFLQTVKDLPLISSYCMAMPITGSYYGFLTLVSANGLEMNYKQLQRNYAMFNDVKVWAKKFVREHSIKLHSADPLVQHSIKVARGEKQQWDNMKSGLKSRVFKIGLGVVETAVGEMARRG